MNPQDNLVWVQWLDAHDDANAWTAIDDLDKEKRVINTVGIQIKNFKEDHISVALSCDVDAEVVSQVIHIPINCVLSIHHLTRFLRREDLE